MGKAIKSLEIYALLHISHFPGPSSGPDWSLCQANSGPLALCLIPLS